MDEELSLNLPGLLSGREFTTQEIVRAVGPGYTRKDINRCLYALERQGRVRKVSESPPSWTSIPSGLSGPSSRDSFHRGRDRSSFGGHASGPSPYSPSGRDQEIHFPSTARSRSISPKPSASSSTTSEIQTHILETLLHSSSPKTATELAKVAGLRGAVAVNSELAAMEKNGLLRRIIKPGSNVRWELASRSSKTVKSKSSMSVQKHTSPFPLHGQSSHSHEGMYPRFSHTSVNPSSHKSYRDNQQSTEVDRHKILQVLKENLEHPQKASALAAKTGISRHQANSILYQLEKEHLVTSFRGSGPPTWVLRQQEPEIVKTKSVGRGADVYRRLLESQHTPSPGSLSDSHVLSDLETNVESIPGEIISLLQSRTELMSSQSITEYLHKKHSKAIGEPSDVEEYLQELECQGAICSLNESNPPLWGIPGNPNLESSSLAMSNQDQSTSDSNQEVLDESSRHEIISNPKIDSPQLLPVQDSGHVNASIVNELNRNPVSALSEYCQAHKLTLEFPVVREYGPPHLKHFVVAAIFGTYRFEAEATNKKEARRMAADLALQTVRASTIIRTGHNLVQPSHNSLESDVNTEFQDHIATLAHGLYARLEAAVDMPQPGRKVIACFIMEDTETGQMDVVSFGSGTRCITGDKMSLKGDVVNDSHAEILARRGLVRFFYQELCNFYEHGESVETIFDSDESVKNYVGVKDSIKFHLYISTAPCGDGAQFSREDARNREPPPDCSHLPTMATKVQGVFRTKMEGGEGTIPVLPDAQMQTWDGIQQGGRLRTMSCSDKIARWNVLGLQGALLSLFMAPVYMSSLTLGSLHHHGHLSRAVCCRFYDLSQYLPTPFSVNHPVLGRIAGGDEMKRHVEKTSSYCMNWVINDDKPEVTDGTTGRPVSSSYALSQVCKAQLYSHFLSLSKLMGNDDLHDSLSYHEAKSKATIFQHAKSLLYQYSQEHGMGIWVCKPQEQDQFNEHDLLQLGLDI